MKVFIFIFQTPTLKSFFKLSLQHDEKLFDIWNLKKNYVLNKIFHICMTVVKVAKHQICLKILTSYVTTLTLMFFAFSLAQTKTKVEQLNS